jgi:crossover junction endodeoxyribonuclease RusA
MTSENAEVTKLATISFDACGPNEIVLTLPWPPTVNTYWRNVNGRTILSAPGRAYRKAVADQVLIQRAAKRMDTALLVTIKAYRPDRRRRDLDNLFKAILDSLVHAGVMLDDALICDLRIFWADEVGGMVKVKILELP